MIYTHGNFIDPSRTNWYSICDLTLFYLKNSAGTRAVVHFRVFSTEENGSNYERGGKRNRRARKRESWKANATPSKSSSTRKIDRLPIAFTQPLMVACELIGWQETQKDREYG